MALLSGPAADLVFDGVVCANAQQRLVGQRTGRVVLPLMDFVEFSAAMRPACSFDDSTVRKDPVISSIGIRLQYPRKAAQMTSWILTLAVLGVLVPHRRWRGVCPRSVIAGVYP